MGLVPNDDGGELDVSPLSYAPSQARNQSLTFLSPIVSWKDREEVRTELTVSVDWSR